MLLYDMDIYHILSLWLSSLADTVGTMGYISEDKCSSQADTVGTMGYTSEDKCSSLWISFFSRGYIFFELAKVYHLSCFDLSLTKKYSDLHALSGIYAYIHVPRTLRSPILQGQICA